MGRSDLGNLYCLNFSNVAVLVNSAARTIQYKAKNTLDANGEYPFVIKVSDNSYIVQEFQVEDGIVFMTTIREKEIKFEPDPASGNLKPDYYPIDVDREIIDAIADGIEKYCL